MIDKAKIVGLVKEKLTDDMFMVDITISAKNAINVYVDSNIGVTIKECIAISRNIEGNLDREVEDFELQVSSPGLDHPFKVRQQYEKNVGKQVEVINNNGIKTEGTLLEANNEEIILEVRKREKVEGYKKKQLIVEQISFRLNSIKSTKTIISFK